MMNESYLKAKAQTSHDQKSQNHENLLLNAKEQGEVNGIDKKEIDPSPHFQTPKCPLQDIRDFVMPVDQQIEKQRRSTKRLSGASSLLLNPDTKLTNSSIEVYFNTDLKRAPPDEFDECSIHLSKVGVTERRKKPETQYFSCTSGCVVF
ncbi:unnamed protein product [Moneuplotes crassus]|uniref:Uncharacterized protein n=1 Tax=Euplotes crassus TaxID=5936 RepID=A0AAD1XPT9_EUPCR|nr:unnamed protein product [Moneuplotes crassus]